MRILAGLLVAVVSLSAVADDGPFHFNFEELAPGVWSGVRDDSPRFPVMGNVTFVISDEGVVVYDGGGMPAMAEQTMQKIQSLTDAPVTHVVISHWHGDHNFGIFRFAEEYPDVEIIAHEFTNTVFNSTRIAYIDRQRNFVEGNREEFTKIAETGIDSEGKEHSEGDRNEYVQILEDSVVIEHEFNRAKVTPANVTLTDKYTIESGGRSIEILYLGQANTAGDIVMWLPEEKIVATGDIVVMPSPYAFNVPPRKWAETLQNINALDYDILVPGHGEIQRDTEYVDLIIEAANSIADQRDALLAKGKTTEEVQEALDFSAFEERFTHGDEYVKGYYDAYFEVPFRAAAMKALTGEPMVALDPPVAVPFDAELWDITGESEFVEYLGQTALKLQGGLAVLKETEVHNGVVEFDIAITEERGFAGLAFRIGETDYEHFYVRPHQSGKPDANQYTPVINGVSGWQLYHGEKYAAPTEYRHNEWMHVKVVFAGDKGQVYIDSDTPVLSFDLMLGDISGQLGLNSSQFSATHFANFQYSPLAELYTFPPAGPSTVLRDKSLVANWEVSEPFDGEMLGTTVDMSSFETNWTVLESEATGITNLARVNGLDEAADTVFACLHINAEQAGLKQLKLGYSDRATVYVNGKAIYEGDNTYMTRDYRYLGTIGLFDSVYLPLNKGDNEVWIAVSESFGGWGVMGQIADSEGIELLLPQ
jgi:glyoxylase-like metal-dependent hydrolase (beta-lactamase superfamily II)